MNFLTILKNKRNGSHLTREEIQFFIDGIMNKTIPEYQTAAFLMSVYFSGLDFHETIALTDCMINSGERITLPKSLHPTCDKHSTGGVGDKISIPLASIVSACGITVGMMSGRALGHTGGTLDKLESIPGFNINLTSKQFIEQLKKINVAMIGQTDKIVPADKILYSLRDATATVESIPLIAASIMSKKIAEGTKNLLIDLKLGKGAFIKSSEDAKKLAKYMILIGKNYSINTEIIITDMNEPIGDYIGNGNEIIESIELLKNKKVNSKFHTLTLELAAHMLAISKKIAYEKAISEVKTVLNNGNALSKFKDLLLSQSGNTLVIHDYNLLKRPMMKKTYSLFDILHDSIKNGKNNESIYISEIDAYKVGIAANYLGAGRFTKEDTIDHSAGITLHKHVGDSMMLNDPIFDLYASDSHLIDFAYDIMKDAYTFSNMPPEKKSLIVEIINSTFAPFASA